MTEEQGAAGTQADPGTQPPAGGPETQADNGQEQQSQPETMSLDEAKKLRAEANSLRKRIKEVEDRDLTETQKAQRELDELRKARESWDTERRELRLQMHVAETARQMNFQNPAVAYRLLDRSEVQYADDGTPKNAERLLQQLAEAEPYLVSKPASTTGSWGAGVGRPTSIVDDMNAQIRHAAGRG